jgi:hypothetical protein
VGKKAKAQLAKEQRAKELAAKQAITEVLHRYCRALDRMDRPMADTLWHPDGTADYGPDIFQGTGQGFLDYVFATHEKMSSHSHTVSNVLIDVDVEAGTAGSETYASVWLRTLPIDGNVYDTRIRGRYLDRWSRRKGVWAIDHRTYVGDLMSTEQRPEGPLTDGSTVTGRRDRTDASYEVLP